MNYEFLAFCDWGYCISSQPHSPGVLFPGPLLAADSPHMSTMRHQAGTAPALSCPVLCPVLQTCRKPKSALYFKLQGVFFYWSYEIF